MLVEVIISYMFCNADATADFEDFVFEDCEITNNSKELLIITM